MTRARLLILIVSVLTALAGTAASAHAASFTPPVKLTGPAGGEPSIATDGKGNVYVDGPQGLGGGNPGIGFWKSADGGSTFGPGRNFGSLLGGGDSDVLTTPDGTVYIDDLEAASSQVCKSTDHGNTFTGIGAVPDPSGCTAVAPTSQVGPSDDRPWLTTDPKGTLYLTYHEFVSAQPLVFRSDNGGADSFNAGPCGSIITDPTIEANVPTDITGGTLVAKPTTDAAGNFYVLFSTTTQDQNAAAIRAGQPSGTFSQLYVAVSHDHCASFKDYTVYDGHAKGTNTTQFGDIFNVITADGAGNLYAIGAGFVNSPTPFSPTTNVFLSSSSDQGQTWKGPTLIGTTNAAHMLPAAVGGAAAGQLALGYFQTVNGKTDPNDTGGKWTYTTAETGNALAAQPSFSFSDVNPGFVYHNGQICNAGILCGAVPGGPSDRSLLDFTSATVDPAGCPLFTFAGNPTGTPTTNDNTNTFNYATRQLTGCFQPPAPAATAGTAVPLGAAASGACIASARLPFRIRPVPHGRVVRAVAFVNGHRVARKRGRNLKRISFVRPAGQVLHVRIITFNNKGGRVVTKRTFTGCTARTRVIGRPHRHRVKHRGHHRR